MGQQQMEKSSNAPAAFFANASLKAGAKFKYKPRVINGTPIDVPGVQHKITFELEK